MQTLSVSLKQKMAVLLLAVSTIAFNPAMAKSDMEIMADVQKAREALRKGKGDHSNHLKPVDESQKFRGVFYGYLPCSYCAGIKTTLSLKNKNNYLLVTQYAQASTKEFYEKGKYTWDAKTKTVILKSRKDSSIRRYRIEDDATLITLKSDGMRIDGDQDDYTLLRGDKNKSRQVHIH